MSYHKRALSTISRFMPSGKCSNIIAEAKYVKTKWGCDRSLLDEHARDRVDYYTERYLNSCAINRAIWTDIGWVALLTFITWVCSFWITMSLILLALYAMATNDILGFVQFLGLYAGVDLMMGISMWVTLIVLVCLALLTVIMAIGVTVEGYSHISNTKLGGKVLPEVKQWYRDIRDKICIKYSPKDLL